MRRYAVPLLIPILMFALVSCQLTVGGAGLGSGTVLISEGNVTCTVTAGTPGNTCVQTIDANKVVILTATATAGSIFGGWTGQCDTPTVTTVCTVTTTNLPQAVTVKFSGASCQGPTACGFNVGAIGEHSCNDSVADACQTNIGRIGDNACNGSPTGPPLGSCAGNGGSIGDGACSALLGAGGSNCDGNLGIIGGSSCSGALSCSVMFPTSVVGALSCSGAGNCTVNKGAIGSFSCNGLLDTAPVCFNNTGTIGNNSCNGTSACANNASPIGDNQCNTADACQGPASTGVALLPPLGDGVPRDLASLQQLIKSRFRP